MNARRIYAKLASLVIAAWNDDKSGQEKLEAVTKEAQEWFELHDVTILNVLPLPAFAKFALAQFIDNQAADRAQAFAVAYAVQKTYDAVAFVSTFASDLFEDLVENSDALITFVLGHLGIKSDNGLREYQKEAILDAD